MEHIRFELYFSENISLADFVMETIRINKLRMVISEPKLFDNLMLLEKTMSILFIAIKFLHFMD